MEQDNNSLHQLSTFNLKTPISSTIVFDDVEECFDRAEAYVQVVPDSSNAGNTTNKIKRCEKESRVKKKKYNENMSVCEPNIPQQFSNIQKYYDNASKELTEIGKEKENVTIKNQLVEVSKRILEIIKVYALYKNARLNVNNPVDYVERLKKNYFDVKKCNIEYCVPILANNISLKKNNEKFKFDFICDTLKLGTSDNQMKYAYQDVELIFLTIMRYAHDVQSNRLCDTSKVCRQNYVDVESEAKHVNLNRLFPVNNARPPTENMCSVNNKQISNLYETQLNLQQYGHELSKKRRPGPPPYQHHVLEQSNVNRYHIVSSNNQFPFENQQKSNKEYQWPQMCPEAQNIYAPVTQYAPHAMLPTELPATNSQDIAQSKMQPQTLPSPLRNDYYETLAVSNQETYHYEVYNDRCLQNVQRQSVYQKPIENINQTHFTSDHIQGSSKHNVPPDGIDPILLLTSLVANKPTYSESLPDLSKTVYRIENMNQSQYPVQTSKNKRKSQNTSQTLKNDDAAPETNIEIARLSPRSIDTDSGYASPFNCATAELTTDVESENPPTLMPIITQVTSLNPNAPMIIPGACCVCGNVTRKKCLGCYQSYYCTYECQSRHWESHRLTCVKYRNELKVRSQTT